MTRADGGPPSEASPLLERTTSNATAVTATRPPKSWTWSSELTQLAGCSVPLIATYLLQYSFSIITTLVAGRLGAHDLAAASVGVTTMNIVGLAVIEGMATALDTLCSQAYGRGRPVMVGVHVQRMALLMMLACVPIGLLWSASPAILAVLLPEPQLADAAGSFLRVSILGLPGYALFEAGKRFLQAQGDFRTAMSILLLCAPANALLSWVFAFHYRMGLDGAALGAACANNLRLVLLVLAIVSRKLSHRCWGGFSRDALNGWWPMFCFSVAGSAVTLAEWAAFEIVTFSTSYIGTAHLAAQTILTTTSVVLWHVPFSVSVAASTRIGHLIGADKVPFARAVATLYTVVFTTLGVINGLFLLLTRRHLVVIFSADERIRNIAAAAMYGVACFQIVDAIVCGCNGVLRGMGRQDVAARVVFIVNYAAAVPLAIWLELGPWRLELNGVWIGLGLGLAAVAAVETVYMRTTSWHKCVARMRAREDYE